MKTYSYTEEVKNAVIEQYQNGASFKEITNTFSLSINTIYRILRRNNIKRNRLIIGAELSSFEKEYVDNLYIYKNSYKPFLPISNYSNCKYKNEANYFDNINTQDKAYILGLLYADGNVNKNGYVCSLTLQERDKDLINKLHKILQPISMLKYVKYNNSNWQNCYKISLSSKRLCDALIYHGVVPNKSLKLVFPIIPYKFYKDFIRGYYDGDGTINTTKNNEKVSFISTLNFCKEAKLFLLNELNINSTLCSISDNKITTRLQIGGARQVLRFLNWIYKDANLFLQRKYDKYVYINNSIIA